MTPDINAWHSRLPSLFEKWAPQLAATKADLPSLPVAGYLNHDGLFSALQCLKRYPGNAAMLSYAAENRRLYRDCYLVGNQGHATGYYVFPEGLAMDWLDNHNQASLDALALYKNAAYMTYDPGGLQAEGFSREVAYSILNQVMWRRCGIPWDRPLLDTRVGYALGHITQWIDPAMPWNVPNWFIQPFMMGLTMSALITYLEHVEQKEGGGDLRIIPALSSLCTWLWANAWQRGGHTGQFPLEYHAVEEAGKDYGYNDLLNMLVAPAYIWLWSRTGVQSWLDQGAAIWNAGAVTNMGNIAAPKQLNEFTRFACKAASILEMTSATMPGGWLSISLS